MLDTDGSSHLPISIGHTQEDRRLGRHFLRTILSQREIRRHIPGTSIDIRGAWFLQGIDLSGVSHDGLLAIENSRIDNVAHIEHSQFSGAFVFSNNVVEGELFLTGATVSNNVILSRSTFRGVVDFTASTFHGSLIITDDHLGAPFNANLVKLDGKLLLSNTHFAARVSVNSGTIGAFHSSDTRFDDELRIQGTSFSGLFELVRTVAHGDISLANSHFASNVQLLHTQCDGNIYLPAVQIDGSLGMFFDTLGGSVELDHATLGGGIAIARSRIGGLLGIYAGSLSGRLQVKDSRFVHDVRVTDTTLTSVDIADADFAGGVEMSALYVSHDLRCDRCRFSGRFTAHNATVGGEFSLYESTLLKEADLGSILVGRDVILSKLHAHAALSVNNAQIRGGAFMREHSVFSGEVDLRGARIDRDLDLSESQFDDMVQMHNTNIGRQLFIKDTHMNGDVIIKDASIGGPILIENAHFDNGVNLNSTVVGGNCMLSDSAVRGSVDMRSAHVGGEFIIEGASFESTFNAAGIEVSKPTTMERARFGQDVIFSNAKLNGTLGIYETKAGGILSLNSARMSGNFFMRKENEVDGMLDLRGANIAKQAALSGSHIGADVNAEDVFVGERVVIEEIRVTGAMDFGSAHVEGLIDISGGEFDGEISISEATIGGLVGIVNASLRGNFDADGAKIGSGLIIRRSVIEHDVKLGYIVSPGGVFMGSNAISGDLNLSDADVGDLRIFDDPDNRSKWGQESVLVLSGARAASLDNSEDLTSWPKRISSLGFDFQRVVGVDAEPRSHRSIEWWSEWVNRDEYDLMGAAKLAPARLRSAGASGAADGLLFEYRRREQQKTCARDEFVSCIWLGVIQHTMGYGIGDMKFFVVLYLLLLTFIGGSVIFLTVRTVPIATAFRLSLITTMPFLEVDKEKTERLLNGLPNSVLIYLHVQKLFGWALALILVAALAGLTQQG